MWKTLFILTTTLCVLLPLRNPGFNLSKTFLSEYSLSETRQQAANNSRKYNPKSQTVQAQDLFTTKQANTSEKSIANNYKIQKIVIDPGHGGHDSGCSGSHSKEKHLALAISKKMKAAIQAQHPDVQVIMTREIDVFIPLHQRAAIANDNQADLFISVHCNSIRNASSIHGSETYVLGAHKFDENLNVAKRENAAVLHEENYEKNYNFDPNSDEGHITLTLYQNAYLEQSLLFADKVEANVKKNTALRSRGVKQAGFLVLRETAMPSVLIETGYLTNSKDENYLSSANGQNRMAKVVADAFTEYRYLIERGEVVTSRPIQPKSNNTQLGGTPYRRQETKPKTRHNINNAQIIAPQSKIEKPIISKAIPPGNTTVPSVRESYVPTPNVQYRVQLAASKNSLDTSKGRWLRIPEYLVEVINEAGLLKYQARGFYSFTQANAARKELTRRGFKGAWVVAYKNGQKISIQEAKRELGE